MLTEKEKHGISELLERMGSKDLASLSQTVTSRLVVPETNSEAIQAIILHTDKPVDLLRRRKVKKEFLFKYLCAKRVPVEAYADKSVIMSAVLQLWGSQAGPAFTGTASGSLTSLPTALGSAEEESLPEAPAPSRNTSYSSLCGFELGGSGGEGGSRQSGVGGTMGLLKSVLGNLPINRESPTASHAPSPTPASADEFGTARFFGQGIDGLGRPESSHSMDDVADDEDDDEDDDAGIDIGCISSCDEDEDRLPPLSSSFQPASLFGHHQRQPLGKFVFGSSVSEPFNGSRLSPSLTPTPPPPSLSSSYSAAVPAFIPQRSSAFVIHHHAGPSAPSLLSSSAPSSYNPSIFVVNKGSVASSVNTMSPASSSGSPTTVATPLDQSPNPAYRDRGSVLQGGSARGEAHEMAESFVRWFYELLNATFFSSDDAAEFGPQHFWADACAKINLEQGSPTSPSPSPSLLVKDATMISSSTNSESICVQNSGKQVCDALRHVVRKYRVTFNPNITRDGVSGYVDVHGLAIVTACGTLHNPSNSAVCGTFHQQFGLIRDPDLGNNWKIKFTNANLVSKDSVSAVPNLADSTFANSSSAMALS